MRLRTCRSALNRNLVLSSAILLAPIAQFSYAANLRLNAPITTLKEVRDFRRQVHRLDTLSLQIEEQPVESAPIKVDAMLGLAYTDNQDDSKLWNTPFEFDVYRKGGAWTFTVAGSGYGYLKNTDDSVAQGADDVKVRYAYTHKTKFTDTQSLSVIGAVGAQIPSHGEIGGAHWQQNFLGIVTQRTNQWKYSVAAALSHTNGNEGPGVSAYPLYGKLNVGRDLNSDGSKSISVTLDRSLIRKVTSASSFGIEYDFPTFKYYGGVFSLNRGLSEGNRSTSIEFDITRTF